MKDCVRRGEVKSDRGVELQNANNYGSTVRSFDNDVGFKITATNFVGGEYVIFLLKFVPAAAGKQSQEAWKTASKKNGWEAF